MSQKNENDGITYQVLMPEDVEKVNQLLLRVNHSVLELNYDPLLMIATDVYPDIWDYSIIGGIFYAVLEKKMPAGDYLFALQTGLTTGIICLIVVGYMLYLLPNSVKVVSKSVHGLE